MSDPNVENLVNASGNFFGLSASELFRSCGMILTCAALAGGCSVHSGERVAARTVCGVGAIATKTTIAAIKTSGKVAATTAKTTVTTTGSVAKSIASTALVTFRETATGISRQIPYREGLRLYAASQTAKVDGAITSFELIRSGVTVLAAKWSSVKAGAHHDPVLSAGDVVELHHAKPAAQKT